MKELLQYVNPQGPLPEVGRENDNLLIIGGAVCVWEDLRRYDSQVKHDRMVVNDIANYYSGTYHHIATVHPHKMPFFSFSRPGVWKHSHKSGPSVDYVWPLMRDGGTSGLFGVLIGLLMGYEKIILAGIPCNWQPRFFDPPGSVHKHFGRDEAFVEWERALHLLQGRVFSLSGKTKDLLGEP